MAGKGRREGLGDVCMGVLVKGLVVWQVERGLVHTDKSQAGICIVRESSLLVSLRRRLQLANGSITWWLLWSMVSEYRYLFSPCVESYCL